MVKEPEVYDYESIIIFDGSLTEDEYKDRIEKYKKIIFKDLPAKIIRVEEIGRKKLAYEVKGCPEGWYLIVHFATDAAFITEYERLLRIDDDVLKFITLRIDPDRHEHDEPDEEEDEDEDPELSGKIERVRDSFDVDAYDSHDGMKSEQPDALDVMLGFADFNKN